MPAAEAVLTVQSWGRPTEEQTKAEEHLADIRGQMDALKHRWSRPRARYH